MSAKCPNGPVAEWVKLVAALILFPAIAWGVAIERRVVRIEANRFTSANGMAIHEALNRKVDKTDIPAPEVTQMLKRLEAQLDQMNALLLEHITHHNGGASQRYTGD